MTAIHDPRPEFRIEPPADYCVLTSSFAAFHAAMPPTTLVIFRKPSRSRTLVAIAER
jgi:hypothetical protein